VPSETLRIVERQFILAAERNRRGRVARLDILAYECELRTSRLDLSRQIENATIFERDFRHHRLIRLQSVGIGLRS
jgi:hypothetical protein